jgi:hypothetical protein
MTGKPPAELLAELKALAADNRLGAGAALAGLGGAGAIMVRISRLAPSLLSAPASKPEPSGAAVSCCS